MEFKYLAKDKNGRLEKGVFEAKDTEEAALLLHQKGLFAVDIRAASKNKFGGGMFEKVTNSDKIVFTEQISVMIGAGISIIDCLDALKEESSNKKFQSEIQKIIIDIKGGSTLSNALKKFPKTFSPIYVNMVASGEQSGKLEVVFKRLAIQLQKEYELNRKIRGALTYPIFVLFTLIIVMVLILTFVIPQLKVIFDDAGVKLPVLTRSIIGLSEILKKFGLYILIVLAVGGFFLAKYRKTPNGKKVFDRLMLKIPVFGLLLKKSYMARFTRTFASLISSGLPLVDALETAGQTIGNSLYEAEIDKIASDVKSGLTLSDTFKKSSLIPKMVGQLASVGEKSGNIDQVFNTLADFFDRDVESITANLSVMLEPILMVFMGTAIGIVIIAILQPIYGLVNAI